MLTSCRFENIGCIDGSPVTSASRAGGLFSFKEKALHAWIGLPQWRPRITRSTRGRGVCQGDGFNPEAA
jgi:hypothetical protein